MKEILHCTQELLAQTEHLRVNTNTLLNQFPLSIRNGVFAQPTEIPEDLGDSLQSFSFFLICQDESLDRILAKFSSLMQASTDSHILLAYDQMLLGYRNLRKSISDFLSVYHSHFQTNDSKTDLSPIYLACQKINGETEKFAKSCKQILKQE